MNLKSTEWQYMQALRRNWFISDLHLDAGHQDISNQFISLLGRCDASVEHLYILGDLFELWIGDDDDSPFIAELLPHFQRAVNAGTKIHIMHGNRDFLLGKRFLQQTGCEFLPEQTVIDVYGTPVLLMHGDTLCTADLEYLKARKFARNIILQKIFLFLPLSWRRHLAAKARQSSMKHTSNTELSIMDVTHEEVIRLMQLHQTRHLIHGHTHKPDIHQFNIQDHACERIVLPAWHHGGSVFEWREDGGKELLRL